MSKLVVRLFIAGFGIALIIASISYSLPQPRIAQIWTDLLMSLGVGALTAAFVDMLISLTLARPNRWYQRQAIRKLDTVFFNTATKLADILTNYATDGKKSKFDKQTIAKMASHGSSIDLLKWAIDKSKFFHSHFKLTKEQRHAIFKDLNAEAREVDNILTTYGSGLSDTYMNSLMNLSDERYKAELAYAQSSHSEEEDVAAIKKMFEIFIKFNQNPDRVTKQIRKEQFDVIFSKIEKSSASSVKLMDN